ncbi:hypothetical protein GW17_00040186 [Ensete ventricosum]|nr:hypothetical protein GW17_00040186 [Ensete ventricosum]
MIVPGLSTTIAPLHQRQSHRRSAPSPLIYNLTPHPSSTTVASPASLAYRCPLLSLPLISKKLKRDSRTHLRQPSPLHDIKRSD